MQTGCLHCFEVVCCLFCLANREPQNVVLEDFLRRGCYEVVFFWGLFSLAEALILGQKRCRFILLEFSFLGVRLSAK